MRAWLTVLLFVFCLATLHGEEINLVQNPAFDQVSARNGKPDDYDVTGAAYYGHLGGALDFATNGILFPGTAKEGGAVSQLVRGIDQAKGRWITFRFRGLAEDAFQVPPDGLKMKIEFFSKNGTDYLDCASHPIDSEIALDRKNLDVNGDHNVSGAAVWRSYELEELIPFPEVDTVKISVSYTGGMSSESRRAAFLIDDFSLIQRTESLTGRIDPASRIPAAPTSPPNVEGLVSLGGRWFYKPAPGELISSTQAQLTVTEQNADRLFYRSDRLINPFLHNMTAWLRAGYKDEQGKVVTADRFVPDNVVLIFKGDGFLTVKARNLPNHPTARFPGFNPSYIQEMNQTYRLPLEPVPDPHAVAMTDSDANHALPMGPIGIAVNGVAFFNPFDANMRDASNIMDYCCGHPSPDNMYHYHKYPICVNTPFVDKGDGPSEVIGFAFDGLPIYGPYQEAGLMAKDSTSNPLNAFNACFDAVRGWHYHVTPGKYPYIIGGYFAKAEPTNFDHRHGPGGPPLFFDY